MMRCLKNLILLYMLLITRNVTSVSVVGVGPVFEDCNVAVAGSICLKEVSPTHMVHILWTEIDIGMRGWWKVWFIAGSKVEVTGGGGQETNKRSSWLYT